MTSGNKCSRGRTLEHCITSRGRIMEDSFIGSGYTLEHSFGGGRVVERGPVPLLKRMKAFAAHPLYRAYVGLNKFSTMHLQKGERGWYALMNGLRWLSPASNAFTYTAVTSTS